MLNQDLFSTLGKYNSATDENYLTEAFVFIIETLLERERYAGVEFLNQLCVENPEDCFSMNEDISISTQEVTELGVPDIKISTVDKLIYIEVKHDSPIGYQQLERYNKVLASSTATTKNLILLTRFAIDFEKQEEKPSKYRISL